MCSFFPLLFYFLLLLYSFAIHFQYQQQHQQPKNGPKVLIYIWLKRYARPVILMVYKHSCNISSDKVNGCEIIRLITTCQGREGLTAAAAAAAFFSHFVRKLVLLYVCRSVVVSVLLLLQCFCLFIAAACKIKKKNYSAQTERAR